MTAPAENLEPFLAQLDTIPGVLKQLDGRLFQAFDEVQDCCGITGNFLEVGVYQGRSAIVLGFLRRHFEELVLCDSFATPSAANPDFLPDTLAWYENYSRETFEANYLRFHDQLPQLHICSSRVLHERLEPDSFRFVHLDGSHGDETIRSDLALARKLLVPGGILAIYGYRSIHTLEVAAAVWEEVANAGLVPLCATDSHLYASWSPQQLGAAGDLVARFEAIPQAIVERREAVPVIRPREVEERSVRATVRSLVPPVLWPVAHRLAAWLGG